MDEVKPCQFCKELVKLMSDGYWWNGDSWRCPDDEHQHLPEGEEDPGPRELRELLEL